MYKKYLNNLKMNINSITKQNNLKICLILYLAGLLLVLISIITNKFILTYIGIGLISSIICYFIFQNSHKKMIYVILLTGLFISFSLSMLWNSGFFWNSDSWRYWGTSIYFIESGFLDITKMDFFYRYPTIGFQSLMSILFLIIGLRDMFSFRILSILITIIPSLIVYLLLKEESIKKANLASFLTFFGIGGIYLFYISGTMTISLGLVIISILLYLDHLIINNKYSHLKIFILHLLFFILLLNTHLWSTLIYILFLFLLTNILILLSHQVYKNYIFNYIFYLLLLLNYLKDLGFQNHTFVRFLLIDKLHLDIFGIEPYIFLFLAIIILSLLAFLLVFIFSNNMQKIMTIISLWLKNNNHNNILKKFTYIIPFLFSVFMYIIYVYTPYFTTKTFIEVLISHIGLIIFLTLISLGVLKLFNSKTKDSIKIIVFTWLLINAVMFIIGFISLNLDIKIIYPWRHLAYMSLLAMIPVTFALYSFRKKRFIKIFVIVLLVLIAIISTYPNVLLKYDSAQEFAVLDWIKLKTPPDSVIAADGRLSGPLWSISERYSTFNYNIIFKESINSTAFQRVLNKDVAYDKNLVGTNYILWSDEYIKKGAALSQGYIKLNNDVVYGFENSKLFDKIYCTKNVYLFYKRDNNNI